MTTPRKSLKSHLLVASAELQDPNFARTVVLLLEHGEDGAFGVVLNRPLERPISDIWQQISDTPTDCKAPAYWGGPVAGPLMVVHGIADLSEVQILPGVYFTANKDEIDLAMQRSGEDLRFFIGCAGWSSGQLESEIAEGAWSVLAATEELVWDGTAELWKKVGEHLKFADVLERFGVKHEPPDPEMN